MRSFSMGDRASKPTSRADSSGGFLQKPKHRTGTACSKRSTTENASNCGKPVPKTVTENPL